MLPREDKVIKIKLVADLAGRNKLRNPSRPFILVFIFLFAVVSAAAEVAHSPVVISEGLKLESMKYLGPMINAVESRIQAWDTKFLQEGISVRRLISAPYGSGFLQYNRTGLDQDYMCVFDLGTLKDAFSKDQAQDLIARLNSLFRVVTRTNRNLSRTPALYLYDNGPVDGQDNLKLDANAVSMIARQIEAIKTGGQIRNAFYDAQGRLVPSDAYPFQIILPINTRMKLATNTVKYYQEMFPGVRDISFQMFFSVGVKNKGKVTYIDVSPLYDKAGMPIPFFDAMVKNVFLSSGDVELYKKRLAHLPEKEIILYSVTEMYLASLSEHHRVNYLKQIKRLHQTYNGLKWAFTPSEQSQLEATFITLLHSDWAIIAADIVEQSSMWLKTDRQMADAFIRAGSLDELVEFLMKAVKLEVKYPHIKAELDELANIIAGLKSKRNLPEKFNRLKTVGQRIVEKIGPTTEEMAQLLKIFSAKLEELGFKSIHIYKIRNQKVSVLKQELLKAGLIPEKVNLAIEQGGIKKEGGYDYVVIDKLGKDEKPLKTILFRSVFTGAPAEKFRKYYEAISTG
jgi:hypothetical protein